MKLHLSQKSGTTWCVHDENDNHQGHASQNKSNSGRYTYLTPQGACTIEAGDEHELLRKIQEKYDNGELKAINEEEMSDKPVDPNMVVALLENQVVTGFAFAKATSLTHHLLGLYTSEIAKILIDLSEEGRAVFLDAMVTRINAKVSDLEKVKDLQGSLSSVIGALVERMRAASEDDEEPADESAEKPIAH
jgi:hypothetical protein